MKRIAFVIPTLDQSGAERQLSLLATGLPPDRFEIIVIALNRGGFYEQEIRAHGIELHVLEKRWRFDPLTCQRLRSSLTAFRPDLIQSFLFAANSYVRLPGLAPPNSRIIVSERCVDTWKSKWQLWLDRQLIPRTHALTANSESVAGFYAGVGFPRDRIHVIPNAMPLRTPEYTREQARRMLGLESHHRVVGFTGRLAPQKRLRDLIWTFQLLHQVVDDVRLVLMGEGPERDELASLATSLGCRDRIVFAGHRQDAFSLLAALDAFVLPSEFEGMSNSLMEAMSLAIPCVVSDIRPNLELVTHETTGLVCPMGHGPAFTRALSRIFQDPEFACRLGTSGQTRIRNEHSVHSMIDAYQRLYETV